MKLQWIAFLTFVRSHIRRTFALWSQTLLPPMITTTLYFLIFGKVIGSNISIKNGLTYAEYITPGLVMLSVINGVYGHVSFHIFIAKFQRSIEEILVSPMSNFVLLSSNVVGGTIRGIFTAILVYAVALFFVPLHIEHPFLSLVVLLLASVVLSLLAFINGLLAKTFDDVGWIPTFVLTPLTYLGSVFYSLDNLPTVWRVISYFNPVYYLISSFRYALLGMDEERIVVNCLGITVTIIILGYICMAMLKKGTGLRQ